MRKPALAAIALSVLLFSAADVARAQLADSAQKFVQVANGYQVTPNLTYLTANNWDAKLDIYQPVGLTGPNPTLVYFHGGGWTAGSKEISSLTFLPYLEMGWTVVNVEYRLASISLAPAAVEDARCALRWMYRNARQYNFDLGKVVLTGNSAGGHLALTTGVLPASAGMERQCPGDRGPGPVSTEELKVAAIINWYGITDVVELLDGPNMRVVRGGMARQHEQSRGDCQACLSAHVCATRASACADDTWRCGSDRPLYPGRAPATGARPGRRIHRARDRAGR